MIFEYSWYLINIIYGWFILKIGGTNFRQSEVLFNELIESKKWTKESDKSNKLIFYQVENCQRNLRKGNEHYTIKINNVDSTCHS